MHPFLRSESYKKGIVFSVGLNIVAKALAFINSIAIAFYFGAQSKTDIYFYCFATVALLVSFIGSLDSSVIIPESMRIRVQDGTKKAMEFLNWFLYFYLAIGIIIISVLFIHPSRAFQLISNFDSSKLDADMELITWFIPICLLMLIANYLTNVLASYRFFTIPIFSGILNNLFSLVILLSFHKVLGVQSLVLGLSLGYLVNIALLILLMKRELSWNFNPKKIFLNSQLKTNMRYALVGNFTTMICGYAPFYIMSNFSAGVVTMFNYARNLAEMPNQVITQQFTVVTGIQFNEQASRKEYSGLNGLFTQTIGFLIFILTPVCGILYLFSKEIVSFLYLRGAFGKEAVSQTAYMLKFLSFSLIYFAINSVVSRLFMATQQVKRSFWFQLIMNSIFIPIIFLASYYHQVNGYIYGTLGFQLITILMIYFILKKYFCYIDYAGVLVKIFQSVLMNILLVIGFKLVLADKLHSILATVTYSSIYLVLIIALNLFLKVDKVSRDFIMQLPAKIKGNYLFAKASSFLNIFS